MESTRWRADHSVIPLVTVAFVKTAPRTEYDVRMPINPCRRRYLRTMIALATFLANAGYSSAQGEVPIRSTIDGLVLDIYDEPVADLELRVARETEEFGGTSLSDVLAHLTTDPHGRFGLTE